jgi:6-pyruvoyltetrahydropterin/6-carboxytetrahydropterin synthase
MLAIWVWRRLEPRLPGLSRIVIHETCTSGCEYRGA